MQHLLRSNPLPTRQLTSTNAPQKVLDAYGSVPPKLDHLGRPIPTRVVALTLTTETNAIRYAVGGTVPVAGGVGHVLTAGYQLRVEGPAVHSLWFSSSAAGSAGTVNVTPETGE